MSNVVLLIFYLVRKFFYYKNIFFVLSFFIEDIAELKVLWSFSDTVLEFIKFLNLIAIVLLSTTLKKMTNKYFSVEHIEYKKKQ